jgi:hypothetical protein
MPRRGNLAPSEGCSCWESQAPMGPCEHPSTPPENQGTRALKTGGCKHRAYRPRSRLCLLKGCERAYRPQHPLTRYCSEACRQRARRWREWKARRRYRQSTGCKQKRRAQSRRYRERQKARNQKKPSLPATRGSSLLNFFRAPATARDATTFSSLPGDPRCSVFVLWPVAMRWSEFWNGRSVGANGPEF